MEIDKNSQLLLVLKLAPLPFHEFIYLPSEDLQSLVTVSPESTAMRPEHRGSVTQTVSEKLNIFLSTLPPPHPLDQLSIDEINKTRDVILRAHPSSSIIFRTITLEEPAKVLLLPFLQAEHRREVTNRTRRPPRLARVLFDAIEEDRSLELCDSVVDVTLGEEVSFDLIEKKYHSPLNAYDLPLSFKPFSRLK